MGRADSGQIGCHGSWGIPAEGDARGRSGVDTPHGHRDGLARRAGKNGAMGNREALGQA